MFNFDSNCTRTQYWSRNITHVHFSNTPHGVPGNEDYGAQASWLIFASIGIYPQAGTTNFAIGSPRVSSASIDIEHIDGTISTLDIVTENNSPENVYVQSLRVNGILHETPFIDRSVLTAVGGCKLEFVMTNVAESGLCAI